MFKYLHIGVVSFLLLFASSCKKDVLHWQKVQAINSGTTSRLNHIRFLDNNICIIGGGETFAEANILRSVDGGFTFVANSYPQAGKSMLGMCLSPSGNLYLCGTDGTVLHSNDSGKNWRFDRIGTWEYYVAGAFPTDDTGVFVSSTQQKSSTITQIDSAFHILDEQTFSFGLNNIYIVDPAVAYVVGYGAVMKSTDHRHTWRVQDPIDDNFTGMDIHGDEIWMCGANGSIYHTINGGQHWDRLRNGNDITKMHYMLRCILFKDELNGWAAGDDGKVIHTDDGGNHWAEYDQFTTSAIRSLAICPNGDILAAGDGGALFRITP